VKPTPQEALHSALEQAELVSDNIVTVYWGEGVTEECAAEVGARLEQLAPDLQVDVIEGGQPHYPYLASVE
jgi:dihydroxyacetone kinase-like predicted kinase